MTELIDADGLTDLALSLRSVASSLETSRLDGANHLSALGYWSDRATFESLIAGVVSQTSSTSADFDIRATGMRLAELRAWASVDESDAYHRFDLGADDFEQIADVLDTLDDLLRTDGTNLWFMSVGDTSVSEEEVRESIGLILGLEPHILRAVLARIDEGLLRKWLVSLDDHDVEAPLLAGLFEHLATNATGTQLGTMALVADGHSRDLLLSALGEHGSAEQQFWAFSTVAARITEEDAYRTVAVNVLGVMNADTREDALLRMHSSRRLDDLIENLLLTEINSRGSYTGTHVTIRTTYDAADLARFLELVGEVRDHDLKAAVFVAAIETLGDPLATAADLLDSGIGVTTYARFDDDSDRAALNALAVLLADDALDIFDALRLNADLDGSSVALFMRELLRGPNDHLSHDGAVQLNVILAELLGDGVGPQNRAEFFQAKELASGGTIDHVNASRLGYFAGALSTGLDDLGAPDDDEMAVAGIVLGAVGLVDPTKVTSVAKVGVSILTEISERVRDLTIAELQDEYDDFEALIVDGILPRDGLYQFEGDAADEFYDKYDSIGGDVFED